MRSLIAGLCLAAGLAGCAEDPMQLESIPSELELRPLPRLGRIDFPIFRRPVCSAEDSGQEMPSVRSIDEARAEGSLWRSTGVSMYYAPVTLLTRYDEEPGVLYVHLVDAENAHVAASYRAPDNIDYRGIIHQLAAADMAIQAQVAGYYGYNWPSHIAEVATARRTGSAEDEAAWLVKHARDVVFFGGDDCARDPEYCELEKVEGYELPEPRGLEAFLHGSHPWPKTHDGRRSAVTVVASFENDPDHVHVFLVDPRGAGVEAWFIGSKAESPAATERAIRLQGTGDAQVVPDPTRRKDWGVVTELLPRVPLPTGPPPIPPGTDPHRFAKHLVTRTASALELPACRM